MQLKYTILYVADVPSTLNFFCDAFDFKIKMLHESGDYGELATGSTTLSFSSLKLMEMLGKSVQAAQKEKPCFEIAFETDDVQGALDKALAAGAELVQPVKQEAWGQTTSYVYDLNGFLIEICSVVHA